MPRRSNTSDDNSRRRRQTRINVIASNQVLRNTIRNSSNIIRNAAASNEAKERAKTNIMNAALRVFAIQRKLDALPRTRAKIVEKMMNAWPYATQRALDVRTRTRRQAETQPRVGQSPRRVTLPAFRNASLVRGPNGKPMVVYFPNN
jgi:hypothetical protein